MKDLMLATKKEISSIHLIIGIKSKYSRRLFYLEHVHTCSELERGSDKVKHAKML